MYYDLKNKEEELAAIESAMLDLQKRRKELERKDEFNKNYEDVMKDLKKCLNSPNKEKQMDTKIDNIVITAKTQVGKTKTIIECILESKNCISVISCDNNSDQQFQLTQRLKKQNIEIFTVKNFKNIKKLQKSYEENNQLVFCILNNNSQIGKLTSLMKDLNKEIKINGYNLYHDEGDTVSKSDNVNTINPEEPKGHKEWVEHCKTLNAILKCDFKRVWISATPENINFLYDVPCKNVFVLPTPKEYKNITKHHIWDSDNQILNEVRRIRRFDTKEVILVCKEYINEKQEAESLALHNSLNCPVICYNGQCIKFFGEQVEKEIESIPEALDEFEEKGYTGPVVIVGYKLMDRGISFVSSNKTKPFTASVMFYKCSPRMYAVSVVQRLGRITGTSRPDLERIVYCDEKIYKNYNIFLENQEKLYKNLIENQNMCIGDVCNMIGLEELSLNADRPALQTVNKKYKEASKPKQVENVNPKDKIHENDDMKRLVISWKNPANNKDVAKLFREMIKNGGFLNNKIVAEKIKNIGAIHALTQEHKAVNWMSVFSKDNTNHYIKQEAIEYYNSL